MVELTGASSNFQAQVRRLATHLSEVLAVSTVPTGQLRQVQRRLTAEQLTELADLYRAGAGIKDLAAQFGVHGHSVATHLRRAGEPLRPRGLLDAQVEEAIRLYLGGQPLVRLAERFECDPETVRRALKLRGVVLRMS